MPSPTLLTSNQSWFQVALDSGIGFVAGLTLGSSGRAMLGAIVGLAGYTGGIVIYNHFADKDLTFSLKDASLSMIISGLTSWLDKWVVPNTMLGRFTSGTTAAIVYHVLTDDNKFGSVAESSLLIAGGASNWILNFLPPWASDLVGGVVNAMLSATSSALDE